ncbi:MAG TPA: Ku protein [Candidatus Binatia bacterium]|nr:Ku protein [Candidatus Binatia bacterium]
MAMRPTWRGHLRLALVSCPVRLTPATTSSSNIRFHKLNRKTGNRLRQQMIDAETGKVVERDETIMGYEFEKGRYVKVEPEEIEGLKIESSEIITIERIVPAAEVDWLFAENPYIVEPDDKNGLDIFATIREALKAKEVVGIGRLVLARREHPVMVQPRGKGLMLVTLHDPQEVRLPEEIFDEIKDVKVDKQNLAMAETLIERMEGEFDLSMFEDRYQAALQELVEAKMKGKKITAPTEVERPSNVVNLFEALKASVAAEKGTGRAASKRPAKTAPPRAAAKKAAVRKRA